MLPTVLVSALFTGLLIAFALTYRRAISNDKGEDKLLPPQNDNRYWGVTLVPPETGVCCQLMRDLQGRNFRKEESPPLPLSNCPLLHCQCRYHYLPERRSGEDRRSGSDRRGDVRFEPDKSDRRSGIDRRRDHNVWSKVRDRR